MSPSLANFLFETANFLVLAGALAWFSFKPLRNALNAERDRHGAEEARIAQLREEAESLTRAAREAHERLDEDLEQRREELLRAAHDEAAQIKADAHETAAAQMRTLEQDHAATRRAQSELFADTLGRIAAASLRRLLERLDGPELDLALTRGACAELSGLAQEARRGAVVESARPLDARARELLGEQLGSAFEERLVPDLGAGVRVTTRAAQVDATALALARHAAREVTDAELAADTQEDASARASG